mgnify:CR=1 FL=1
MSQTVTVLTPASGGGFFVCDVLSAIPKDDLASMEHPLFSLSTRPDRRILNYTHNDTEITVTPSVRGLATIHDKDILIFCISQLMAAVNAGRATARTLHLRAHDLLVATGRETSGDAYRRLRDAFERLAGTRITTNIEVGGREITSGFGLIERWEIVRASKGGRMVSVAVTLSEWLYGAVMSKSVLTLSREYFSLRKPLERRLYRRYERIACISHGVKEALDAWLGEKEREHKTQVVRNGSRLLSFCGRARRREAGLSLVSVGSLSRQKGFDIALRAVATLGDRVKRYTIVGEGEERHRLEALTQQLGIQDKVMFAGFVDNVEVYLHEADLGLIPSRWEGFGLVAVEALSTGLPLVASDVDGMREVLADCSAANLFKSEDVTELVDAVGQAAEALVGEEEVAASARTHAEKFSLDSMVEGYADFYRRVLES